MNRRPTVNHGCDELRRAAAAVARRLFFQAQAWNALFAPEGTPQPVLDKLTDTLDKALDDEQTRKRMLELGSVLPAKAGRGQQALAALVKSEIARWTPVIKSAGPLN